MTPTIKSLMLFMILNATASTLYPQSNLNTPADITSISDLKSQIRETSFVYVISAVESWLPDLVASTTWETRISPHFLIHYFIDVEDEDDVLFDSLLQESEIIYDHLMRFFDIQANTKKEVLMQQSRLMAFIVKTDTKLTFGFLPEPHTFLFILDTKQTPDYMEKFRHEYAHWVWGRSFGEAPSFFWEGVATYAEKMSMPGADGSKLIEAGLEIEAIPPLTECVKNEVFWSQKGMYTAGSIFVQFLVESWGWDSLKRLFLMSDYEDAAIHRHFEEVYGISLENLEKDWSNFLHSRYGESTP